MKPPRLTVIIPRQTIELAVQQLADSLSQQFAGKEPLFLVVMNGAFIFAADLLRAFQPACTISFVDIKSYSGIRKGDVQLQSSLPDVANRHVIIVEDIVDSGETLAKLLAALHELHTASVTSIALLNKKIPHVADADHYALEVPDVFVVGYGLDMDGRYRNLPDICQLELPS
jgi:hypoxanthine phosphoribosyltransferase